MDLRHQLDGIDGPPDLDAALDHLDDAWAAAWATIEPSLLGLCQSRMAMLLDHRPTVDTMTEAERSELAAWPTSTALSDRERLALALTEQFVLDVAGTTPQQRAGLARQFDDSATIEEFITALLVVEQRLRLAVGLAAVFDRDQAGPVATPTAGPDERPPSLRDALNAFAAAAVSNDGVDPITTELVRMRCATHHACGT